MLTFDLDHSSKNVLVFKLPSSAVSNVTKGWYTPVLVLKKRNFDVPPVASLRKPDGTTVREFQPAYTPDGFGKYVLQSVIDLNSIPKEGKKKIVVAISDNMLSFRIFGDDGKIVVDTNEKKLIGYNLRLLKSWGDGSDVAASGKSLVLVGVNNDGLLHIRIFDAQGNRVTDMDETKLPVNQAQMIATLKSKLPELLSSSMLTDAKKARVLTDVMSIVGQNPLGQKQKLIEVLREQIAKLGANQPTDEEKPKIIASVASIVNRKGEDSLNFTFSIGTPRTNAQLIPSLVQDVITDTSKSYLGTLSDNDRQAVVQVQMIVGAPVKKALVTGYYQQVEFDNTPISLVPFDLFDNGETPDKVADDGIYTGVIGLGPAPRYSADYRVFFAAEHQDGTAFIDLAESIQAPTAKQLETVQNLAVPKFQRATSLNFRVEGSKKDRGISAAPSPPPATDAPAPSPPPPATEVPAPAPTPPATEVPAPAPTPPATEVPAPAPMPPAKEAPAPATPPPPATEAPAPPPATPPPTAPKPDTQKPAASKPKVSNTKVPPSSQKLASPQGAIPATSPPADAPSTTLPPAVPPSATLPSAVPPATVPPAPVEPPTTAPLPADSPPAVPPPASD